MILTTLSPIKNLGSALLAIADFLKVFRHITKSSHSNSHFTIPQERLHKSDAINSVQLLNKICTAAQLTSVTVGRSDILFPVYMIAHGKDDFECVQRQDLVTADIDGYKICNIWYQPKQNLYRLILDATIEFFEILPPKILLAPLFLIMPPRETPSLHLGLMMIGLNPL